MPDPATPEAPEAVKWVRVGDWKVRADQIAAWHSATYTGRQTIVLYVTLLSGEKVESRTTWDAIAEFEKALP